MRERTTNCFSWAGRLVLAFSLVMAQSIEAGAQTAPAKPRYVTVEKNQLIEMALVDSVSSATAREGDEITFQLTEPLTASGETVLSAGFALTGRITKAEKAGPNCKAGKLEWKIEDPKSADGTTIRLRPAFANRESDSGKLVEPEPPLTFGEKAKIVALAPIIAVGFILFAPIALAFMATDREPKCFVQGCEDSYKAGFLAHAAVTQRVKVAVAPKIEDADVGATGTPAGTWEILPVRLVP